MGFPTHPTFLQAARRFLLYSRKLWRDKQSIYSYLVWYQNENCPGTRRGRGRGNGNSTRKRNTVIELALGLLGCQPV